MSVPLHKIQRRAEMFLDSYPKTCHHPVQQLLSDAETVCCFNLVRSYVYLFSVIYAKITDAGLTLCSKSGLSVSPEGKQALSSN